MLWLSRRVVASDMSAAKSEDRSGIRSRDKCQSILHVEAGFMIVGLLRYGVSALARVVNAARLAWLENELGWAFQYQA